ncbi:MAG: CYTH and CHAD domain-containing protein [Actinomycetia bacterium]|nr:CYTH and CHAD domain-containing protein [Actinomycetes bacterium]
MNTKQSEPTLQREVERKLRVGKGYELPDLAEVPGVARVVADEVRELVAVYHDTEDLRLFRWGVTLRRREGGPDAGWHMKLPVAGAGDGVRDEVHLPLSAGAVGVVPPQLSDIVAAFTQGEPLRPVATVANRRKPFTLFDPQDHPVIEVVLDNVVVTGGLSEQKRFREVEVEALDPAAVTSGLLGNVADAAQAAGGRPTKDSKVTSALGSAAAEPPPVSKPTPTPASADVAEFLTAVLATQCRKALLQDVRVRRALPDSVHKLRVAFRRIRSALTTYKPLFSAEWASDLRDELRWAASELGPFRDTEVLRLRFADDMAAGPSKDQNAAAEVLEYQLDKRMAAAESRARAALASSRYKRLLQALELAAISPELGERAQDLASEMIPPLVAKRYRKLDRDVAELSPSSSAITWHTARKDAKKVRYATQDLIPLLGAPADALAKEFEAVTELLGDHQDAHVARTTLREIASRESGSVGYALGLLGAQQGALELRNRREFLNFWPTVQASYVKAGLVPK